MTQSINKIIIVGGGTAGWSTAAILSNTPKLDVVVVQSPTIPIIGVGESTIPIVNIAHARMGLDVFKNLDWLDRVDGVVKFSIEFEGFNENGKWWLHPFFKSNGLDRVTLSLNDFHSTKSQSEYVHKYTQFGAMRKAGFVSNAEWGAMAGAKRDCGYQVNAALYAELIADESCKRSNVTRIISDVTKVNLDADGNVSGLQLTDGSVLAADLYVDCTGMSSLLIDAVGSEFVSIQDRLIVDSVVVTQLPCLDKQVQLQNTTTCRALSSGWVWNIGLESRIGTGYIYSSKFTTAEEAVAEFKEHLRSSYGYVPADIEVKRIFDFRTGYREQSWTKNVVAIGMSSFFAEPIESTAIAVFQNDATQLATLVSSPHIPYENKVANYNTAQKASVMSILEFAELHYLLTSRDDTPFWSYYKNRAFSPVQRKILASYLNDDASVKFDSDAIGSALGGASLFDTASYRLMFFGYGLLPKSGLAVWK